MKKSELQKIIREEVRKATNEGYFTTYLTPEQVEDLKAIVTKIDELKAAMAKASKSVRNRTIEQMIQASPGQVELNTLRTRMTTIYQLKDLEK